MITELLVQSRNGDRTAIDRIMPLVYKELRRLAAYYLAGQQPGHTLQPTALVHEAYLRLAGRSVPDLRNRVHFFSVAARIMRQVLVDHARTKFAAKRRGAQPIAEFRETLEYSDEKAPDLVALDDALKTLAAFDERKVRILELRFFGGLSVEETAEALGISAATVGRETRYAKAWLSRELKHQSAGT